MADFARVVRELIDRASNETPDYQSDTAMPNLALGVWKLIERAAGARDLTPKADRGPSSPNRVVSVEPVDPAVARQTDTAESHGTAPLAVTETESVIPPRRIAGMPASDTCGSIKDLVERNVRALVHGRCPSPLMRREPFRTGNPSDPFEVKLYSILERGGLDVLRCQVEVASQRSSGGLPFIERVEIARRTFSWLKELWLSAGDFQLWINLAAPQDLDFDRDSNLRQLENVLHNAAHSAAGFPPDLEQAGELPGTHRDVAEESRSAASPAEAGNTLHRGGYATQGKGAMDKPSTPTPADLGLLVPGTLEDKRVQELIEGNRKAEEADPESKRRRQKGYAALQAWYDRQREAPLGGAQRQEKLIRDARKCAESYLPEAHSPVARLRVTRLVLKDLGITPNTKKFPLSFEAVHAAIWTEGYPSLEERATGVSIIAKLPKQALLRMDAKTAAFLADYLPKLEREANKSGPVHDAEFLRELVIHQFTLVARECMAVCASVEEFEAELRSDIARFVCCGLTQYGWLAEPMLQELETGFTFFVMGMNPWAEIPEADRESKWHVGAITGEALSYTSLKLMAEATARAVESQNTVRSTEPVTESAVSVPPFPNRAKWLKARLAERVGNKHELQRHGGPEHRTTQKILDGGAVQEDVLRKVIVGLQSKQTHKGRTLPGVAEPDIPND